MSIRKKLVLTLLLSGLLPLLIFVIISLNNSIKIAEENAMKENMKKTEVVQEKIINFIDKNLYGIKLLSTNSTIRSLDSEKIKPVIVEAASVYKDLSPIVVTNSNAMQIVKSDNAAMSNVSDRNFYQEAIKGQGEVVSEVIVSKDNGHLISVLATNIKDNYNGNIIGVVQGSIELSVLNNFAKGVSSDTTNVYILDEDGKLLASKDFDQAGDRVSFTEFDFVKRALSGNNGSEEIIKDGKRMLVSYVKNKKSGWIICSEIPYSTAISQSVNDAVKLSIVGVLLLILTSIAAFILSKFGVKPINKLLSAADSISNGDLSIMNIDVKSNDELGHLSKTFGKMTNNLRELINNIKDYSLEVSDYSKEMITVCEQQAQVSEATSVNINCIVEETTVLNSNINKISDNMNSLSQCMSEIGDKSNIVIEKIDTTKKFSDRGIEALYNVNLSMKNIQESFDDIYKIVNILCDHSKSIGQITEAIKTISEQTNLLALNAAIEASRAGEHGKGFAVVSEEVRKLAEESGESAKKVQYIINGIQKETENASRLMNRSVNEVQDGVKSVEEASSYFDLISKAIYESLSKMKEVGNFVKTTITNGNEIFTTLNNIENFSEKVSLDTQNISAATEEQVASIEEITAAMQNLNEMVENLEVLMSKFKTEVMS